MSDGAYRDDREAAAELAAAVQRERYRMEVARIAGMPRLPTSVDQLLRDNTSVGQLNMTLMLVMAVASIVAGIVAGEPLLPEIAVPCGLVAALAFATIWARASWARGVLARDPQLIVSLETAARWDRGVQMHSIVLTLADGSTRRLAVGQDRSAFTTASDFREYLDARAQHASAFSQLPELTTDTDS